MVYSSCCSESQREAALLLGQFAAADSDCKVYLDFVVLVWFYCVDWSWIFSLLMAVGYLKDEREERDNFYLENFLGWTSSVRHLNQVIIPLCLLPFGALPVFLCLTCYETYIFQAASLICSSALSDLFIFLVYPSM